MKEEEFKQLLEKYKSGTCSSEEIVLLESWYLKYVKESDASFRDFNLLPEYRDMMWQKISNNLGVSHTLIEKKNRPIAWPRFAAAAVLLITLSAGLFVYFNKINKPTAFASQQMNHKPQDVLPGSNKAILILGNGKTINLNEATAGKLAEQAGSSIQKTENGQVIFTIPSNAEIKDDLSSFTTIRTPRGGQYQVVLSDGTRIWMNAASVLKFPSTFANLKERKIQLTGEAYFEVKKDKKKPFIVESGHQSVEVLGTHFNIKAYPEEDKIYTTLLEGKVKLQTDRANALLKPGEYGVLNDSKAAFNIGTADVETVVAWKNGQFKFNNTSLFDLMRQISRWYNVDVIYQGKVADDVFTGKINRNSSLSKVLKILELTNLNFRIQDNKIIVTN